MVVLWLYAGCRIAASRAKAVRKRRCGAHKTLRFANLLQARRAAVPIGGAKPARLSTVRPLRPAQTLFRQKAAFLFMDKPARKSAKRTAFAKGQVGRGGAGTPPSRACADRRRPERRLFCGRRRARPPQPVLSFLREKSARAVLSFAGHLMRNQKRRRTDGAAAPQDGKAPAKTRRAEAAACRGPLRRDAHAGRRKPPRREGFPSRSTRPRVGQEKRTFSAPLRLVKEGAFSKPLRGRGFARLLRKANRKGDKARAGRLGGRKRAPKRARGEGPRRRASRRAGNPAVTSGLRAGRLFYSNCKGRFSSLFFSILIMLVPNPPRTARRKRQEGRFFLEDHH